MVNLFDYKLFSFPSLGAAAKAFVGGYGKANLSKLFQIENCQIESHGFETHLRRKKT
jgi:hypothetical protein